MYRIVFIDGIRTLQFGHIDRNGKWVTAIEDQDQDWIDEFLAIENRPEMKGFQNAKD